MTNKSAAKPVSTVADVLVRALRSTGTKRMFGLPGGGSSLDLIDAASRQGVPFVLARHETSAAIMAATTAELDGSVGCAIVTKGPGTANAANGVAHASLDRCALAMVTDGFSESIRSYVTHQWFDQQALLAPIVKAHSTLESTTMAQIESLLALANSPERGPVHLELTGPTARELLDGNNADGETLDVVTPSQKQIADAKRVLSKSRKPIIVVGLDARPAPVAAAIKNWVNALACPLLATYKAKGIVADSDSLYAGNFTGGAAEKAIVDEADLIILIGVDPVEFILQPWPHEQPVLELNVIEHAVHYVKAAAAVFGDLASTLEILASDCIKSQWVAADVARLKQQILTSIRYGPVEFGVSPEQVVTVADKQAASLSRRPRISVDAGAHMFSATTFWPCHSPNDLLISNGLASMGFALPAGIASCLHEPDRYTVAFTGDGGLMMCMGELATAVEQNVKLIVIVFNDSALSLIDIKQQQRELKSDGVRWPRVDFSGVMTSLGGQGFCVSSLSGYKKALARAFAFDGPSLIDVAVDPAGYATQLRSLRG